jgi:hypothetical protein
LIWMSFSLGPPEISQHLVADGFERRCSGHKVGSDVYVFALRTTGQVQGKRFRPPFLLPLVKLSSSFFSSTFVSWKSLLTPKIIPKNSTVGAADHRRSAPPCSHIPIHCLCLDLPPPRREPPWQNLIAA